SCGRAGASQLDRSRCTRRAIPSTAGYSYGRHFDCRGPRPVLPTHHKRDPSSGSMDPSDASPHHDRVARPQGAASGRILVVDDLDANRKLLGSLLTREGYRVTFAEDGRTALDMVARDQPDLVLMDVMMPNLNGFDACLAIKRNPTTRFIPVVIITA